MPEFGGGAGVDGPDVVRRGDVDNAARDNRRSFDLLILVGIESPHLLKFVDVFLSNFGQAGVPFAGVIAVEGEPAIGLRVGQRSEADRSRRRFIST